MRSEKVRRVDFHPDEYLAGTNRLTAEEQGVYWVICSLIYSRGGPIDDDLKWLTQHFYRMHWRTLAKILDSLARHGKIVREGCKIASKRCGEELEKAQSRVAQARQNGARRWQREQTDEAVLTPSYPPSNRASRLVQAPIQDGSTLLNGNGLADANAYANQEPRTNKERKNPHTPIEQTQPAVTKPRAKRAGCVDPRFDVFWPIYPLKVGKDAAAKAWLKAIQRATVDEIMAGLDRAVKFWAANPEEATYTPHPATWLNQGRWSDVLVARNRGRPIAQKPVARVGYGFSL